MLNFGSFSLIAFFCCVMCLQALPVSFLDNGLSMFHPITSIKIDKQETQDDFGKLKLCPPGGRSFFEAFQMACPMRKRRKRSTVMFDELLSAIDAEHMKEAYRPAKPDELMQICCHKGCDLTDFFPYCGPFK